MQRVALHTFSALPLPLLHRTTFGLVFSLVIYLCALWLHGRSIEASRASSAASCLPCFAACFYWICWINLAAVAAAASSDEEQEKREVNGKTTNKKKKRKRTERWLNYAWHWQAAHSLAGQDQLLLPHLLLLLFTNSNPAPWRGHLSCLPVPSGCLALARGWWPAISLIPRPCSVGF